MKLRLALFMTFATALGACDAGEEKAQFASKQKVKPFDKLELTMCGEDLVERPSMWEERRSCTNDGRLFLDYYAKDKKDVCLDVPGRSEVNCSSAVYAGKMRKALAQAKELYRLYYASNDAEGKYDEFIGELEEVAGHYIKRLETLDDAFLLNCYEYPVRGKLGVYTVLAVDSYFPNKRTTHTDLKCSLYSQFVHTTPCMQFLSKLEVGSGLALQESDKATTDKIRKEEKFGQDELVSGEAIDKQNDDLLKNCLAL